MNCPAHRGEVHAGKQTKLTGRQFEFLPNRCSQICDPAGGENQDSHKPIFFKKGGEKLACSHYEPDVRLSTYKIRPHGSMRSALGLVILPTVRERTEGKHHAKVAEETGDYQRDPAR